MRRSHATWSCAMWVPLSASGSLEAANGVLEIAVANMTRAVKAVSTYRGRDPRDFALIAFGGNGPVVGAAIARALGLRKVIVPPAPGVFSAAGLLFSRVEREFSETVFKRVEELDANTINARFDELIARGIAVISGNGYSAKRLRSRTAW